ncbi:hypothetical protein L596_000479 [Steinernema carpocapsae]|uniref:Uncharacterized protein n=1 Tax=Steinernema carpocapsae TaxID=34508 RepID=A0A4U8UKL1_STECR|nr:hypothetical protein L596_000479 [Steinernema carpocapsae]
MPSDRANSFGVLLNAPLKLQDSSSPWRATGPVTLPPLLSSIDVHEGKSAEDEDKSIQTCVPAVISVLSLLPLFG